jgi:hypothetical protein
MKFIEATYVCLKCRKKIVYDGLEQWQSFILHNYSNGGLCKECWLEMGYREVILADWFDWMEEVV